VAEERGPEHPSELGRPQAAKARVVDEVDVVVPAEKLSVERGQEGQDRERGDQQGRQPRETPRDRRLTGAEGLRSANR
jgi:hypothetical protein